MTFTGSRLEEDAQSHPGKRTGAQHTSDGHWVGRLTLTPLSVEPLWPLTIFSFLDLQDLGRSDHLTVTLRGLCRILQLQDNNLFGQREEIKNNWTHLMCARFNYQSANQIDPHEGHFFGSEWFLFLLALILLQTGAEDCSLLEQRKSRRKKGYCLLPLSYTHPSFKQRISSYMDDLRAAAEQE